MCGKPSYCANCERDCSAPQCDHCVEGSQQLLTELFVNYEPTFTVGRAVLKGSEDENFSPLSKTDRRK